MSATRAFSRPRRRITEAAAASSSGRRTWSSRGRGLMAGQLLERRVKKLAPLGCRGQGRRLRRQAELGGHGGPDLAAGVLHVEVAEEDPEAVAVTESEDAVGHALRLELGAKVAALDPGHDRVEEPVAHALVEAGGRWLQLGMAHRPEPELNPQDPVALEQP